MRSATSVKLQSRAFDIRLSALEKLNMVFLYREKCSENNSDMTLNLIIARNNGFVKKKSRKNK